MNNEVLPESAKGGGGVRGAPTPKKIKGRPHPWKTEGSSVLPPLKMSSQRRESKQRLAI